MTHSDLTVYTGVQHFAVMASRTINVHLLVIYQNALTHTLVYHEDKNVLTTNIYYNLSKICRKCA
jgi:hypothetical protein